MATLYTIGHSTRTLDELVSALKAHGIETLVDIRAFPMSRRLPHFNREALEQSLAEQGIRYIWMQALGGYRKATREDSPHTALRNVADADPQLAPTFKLLSEAMINAQEAAQGLRHYLDALELDPGSGQGRFSSRRSSVPCQNRPRSK